VVLPTTCLSPGKKEHKRFSPLAKTLAICPLVDCQTRKWWATDLFDMYSAGLLPRCSREEPQGERESERGSHVTR
jgi:hypothetical protein